MLGYDDKRNFFRMMINSPCEIVVSDDESTRSLQTVCKDISATGMSFELDESSLEIGTFVNVHIASTSSQIPSLSASARVVRCEANGENSCVIGVEIIEMK
ncbi:MAG: PilZ domain-containing protein [Paraglaciecola sp.]|uniref:PilZ domain-containing protein n=1 Tax=Pseudomonadati TaxID=3379134 RepID=UPI00273DE461|nr:PilZ domain-containing protein [Paraglaciecola sp.]MDP5029421.1 PilZ domain-containing protein [Paraglaciecola sp.]MDP5133008.1 PilZ domain-containing protein [Paraglaciecola sp.]